MKWKLKCNILEFRFFNFFSFFERDHLLIFFQNSSYIHQQLFCIPLVTNARLTPDRNKDPSPVLELRHPDSGSFSYPPDRARSLCAAWISSSAARAENGKVRVTRKSYYHDFMLTYTWKILVDASYNQDFARFFSENFRTLNFFENFRTSFFE